MAGIVLYQFINFLETCMCDRDDWKMHVRHSIINRETDFIWTGSNSFFSIIN